MRTGTAQASPTAHPKITIVVSGDTHISEGGGGNDRVVRASTDEQAWGGSYIIELDNSDEALNAKDYEGEPIDLKFHFVNQSADSLPPLWVDSQEFISKEGRLLLVLNCVDIWALIAAHNVTLTCASYNQGWQTAAELADREMPDGKLITHEDWSSIYDALVANSDMTIWDILLDLQTFLDNVVINLIDEDAYVDTLKPPISITNARVALKQLMDMTNSYLKINQSNNRLHIIEPSAHATAYSFDVANLFFSSADKAGVTIPNRIYFWAFDEAGENWISGTASDSDSYDKIGQWIDRHYLVGSLASPNKRSESDLDDLAAAALDKIKGERNQGTLIAPMHCTLELFDKISITDDRYDTPKTTTGYVHRIQKEYSRGVYTITIQLGGVTTGYTVPGGYPAKGLAEAEPPKAPPVLATGIPVGYQAYIADIDFTSVDQDHISWTSGNVKFADGRIQVVSSVGSPLTLTTTHYLYIIWGNSVLQNSTTYSDAIGPNKVLVAVAAKASTGAQRAYVLNPHTDSILINTDKVMDGLVTELKLAAEAVTNSKVKDLSAEKINAGTLSADRIGAGSIEAIKLDVATLDAISANVGTLTSGIINGVTIYAGAGKVTLDSVGVKIDGQLLFFYEGETLRGLCGVASNQLHITAYSGRPLRLTGGGSNPLLLSLGALVPATAGIGQLGSSGQYFASAWMNILRSNDVLPRQGSGVGYVGKSDDYYATGYIDSFYTQDIRRRTGAGGDIGSSTDNFSALYIAGIYSPAGGSGFVGTSTRYFAGMYATHFYGKSGEHIEAFDELDDVGLISNMKENPEKPGFVDPKTIPGVILRHDGKFVDMQASSSLAFGAIKQLASRVRELEIKLGVA